MAEDAHGLDKAARVAAEGAAAARAAIPPPLDPRFPFVCLPFDPDFFNIPPDPKKEDG